MGFISDTLAQGRLVSMTGARCRRIEMRGLTALVWGVISVTGREQGHVCQVEDLEVHPAVVVVVAAAVDMRSLVVPGSVESGQVRELSLVVHRWERMCLRVLRAIRVSAREVLGSSNWCSWLEM
jgi:hypothetical protein